jgi:hypothetical protein
VVKVEHGLLPVSSFCAHKLPDNTAIDGEVVAIDQ